MLNIGPRLRPRPAAASRRSRRAGLEFQPPDLLGRQSGQRRRCALGGVRSPLQPALHPPQPTRDGFQAQRCSGDRSRWWHIGSRRTLKLLALLPQRCAFVGNSQRRFGRPITWFARWRPTAMRPTPSRAAIAASVAPSKIIVSAILSRSGSQQIEHGRAMRSDLHGNARFLEAQIAGVHETGWPKRAGPARQLGSLYPLRNEPLTVCSV